MMIRARGFSFEMTLDQEATRLQELAKHIENTRPKVLTALGVKAVQYAVTDFRDRSQGKAAAGISWKPLTLGGARTRLAARTPYRNDTKKLESLREEQKPLAEMLRRKLPHGPAKSKNRRAIAQKFMDETPEGKKIQSIQKKRKAIRERRKNQIKEERDRANVGVDTGRLVNSLVYGVEELKTGVPGVVPGVGGVPRERSPRENQESMKEAKFIIQGDSIRIGSNMKYAGYFDEKRPIFPEGFLGGTRDQEMNKVIEKTIDLEVARILKEGK